MKIRRACQQLLIRICRNHKSEFADPRILFSRGNTPDSKSKTSPRHTVLPYSPSPPSYRARFALQTPRGTDMPKTEPPAPGSGRHNQGRSSEQTCKPLWKWLQEIPREPGGGRLFSLLTLRPAVRSRDPSSGAARRAPGSPLADTPHRSAAAPALRPPPAGRGPAPSPAPAPASLGPRAPLSGPPPGAPPRGRRSRARPAARSWGSRASLPVSPNPARGPFPGASPAAAEARGAAWRGWTRRRGAAHKESARGPGGRKTDRRARDARPEQQAARRSGGGRRPSPWAGRIRGGGGGRDLRELECGRRGAGEARTAAPGRRGGGAPLLFLIIWPLILGVSK